MRFFLEYKSSYLTGDEKATLGKAMATLEKKQLLHGNLKTAFNALYGYFPWTTVNLFANKFGNQFIMHIFRTNPK